MTEYIKIEKIEKMLKFNISVLSHYFKSDWCNCKCSLICSRHWNFKQCSRINWPTKLCNKFYYWNISPNTFEKHRYSRRKAAFWTDWCRCFFFLLLMPCQDRFLGFPVEKILVVKVARTYLLKSNTELSAGSQIFSILCWFLFYLFRSEKNSS